MRLDKEPRESTRREFLQRSGRFIGGILAFGLLPNIERAQRRQEVEELGTGGAFYPTEFRPDNKFSGIDEGYFIGGPILERYKVLGEQKSPWGPVRSHEFTYEGRQAQLFADALVVVNPENQRQVSEVPVLGILSEQGLNPWLDEYGFSNEGVPVWKAAVASGMFVPPEALVPLKPDGTGYYPDVARPFPIVLTRPRITIYNYDGQYGFTTEHPDWLDRLMELGRGGMTVSLRVVSSPDEIPGPLGIGKQGDDPNTPMIGNWSGAPGGNHREYLIESAKSVQNPQGPKDFDFWVDVKILRDSTLPPEIKSLFKANLVLSVGDRIYTLLKFTAPHYKWRSMRPYDSVVPPEEKQEVVAFAQEERRRGISLFEIVPNNY